MLGAIAGDIIGSVYEGRPIKTKVFPLFVPSCRFTDDTVLTVAVAQAIMENIPYQETVKAVGREYPHAGYGGAFIHWLLSDRTGPYNSWGNGSAMRVSPVGFAFDSERGVMEEAKKSAEITHDHPEGIRGAQAAALSVFLGRTGASRDEIRRNITERFGYDLERSVDEIRPAYSFDVSCQGSVPESIICFLESGSYEDAVRNAVSLGGDTDTMACIAGAIAEAFYGGIPAEISEQVHGRLPRALWEITERFCRRYYDLSIKMMQESGEGQG